MRKIISSVLLIIGLISFGFGTYIANQVAVDETEMAASSGQHRRVPLVGPVRKSASIQANESMQAKRMKQLQMLLHSEITSNWLRGIGIVFSLGGIAGLLISPQRRRFK